MKDLIEEIVEKLKTKKLVKKGLEEFLKASNQKKEFG
jgi:hypothetical protein